MFIYITCPMCKKHHAIYPYSAINRSSKAVLLMVIYFISFHAYAQQEPPPANSDNYTKYNNNYSAEKIPKLPVIQLNFNQLANQDSLKMNQVYQATYNYTNVKEGPVLIADVARACGCLSIDWYKMPIPPGGTGWIKIKYVSTIPIKRVGTIKVVLADELNIGLVGVQPIELTFIPENLELTY